MHVLQEYFLLFVLWAAGDKQLTVNVAPVWWIQQGMALRGQFKFYRCYICYAVFTTYKACKF